MGLLPRGQLGFVLWFFRFFSFWTPVLSVPRFAVAYSLSWGPHRRMKNDPVVWAVVLKTHSTQGHRHPVENTNPAVSKSAE